jgi:ribose/xylose/arabinose/galactoside ABC-type transport system permease subunit
VKRGAEDAGKVVTAQGGIVTWLAPQNYDNLGVDAAELNRQAIAQAGLNGKMCVCGINLDTGILEFRYGHLGLGVVVGLVKGLLTTLTTVPSLIITLGTL